MCGVVGVVLPDHGHEAAAVAATALFALQHRGQESAGIGVADKGHLMIYKDLGMVTQVLDERRIPSLTGDLAVAHCRYSTTGSTVWENAQPTLRLGPRRAIAVGHNGNLVNTRELLDQLEGGRTRLPASTDTELLTALLADEPATDTVEALRQVLPRVRGAFSLVVLDAERVIGVRDPHGFRPLALGRIPSTESAPGLWGDSTAGWILASETAALDTVGAEYVREVEPGEIVVLEPGKDPWSVRYAEATPALTRISRAGTSTRRAGTWAWSSPRSTRSRRTSSCRSRTRAGQRPRATPSSRGSRTARASSVTGTAAARSSSRPRRCASAA
jgi:amidophosphoribosyltransferase